MSPTAFWALQLSGSITGYASYLVDFTVMVLIHYSVVLALDLQYGYTDIPNFGVTGFFAVGAYTTGVVSAVDPVSGLGLGLPFWAGWTASVVVVAAVSFVIGLAGLRLVHIYFALVTFAFAETMVFITRNLDSVTGGPNGLLPLDQPLQTTTSVEQLGFFFVLVALLFTPFVIFLRHRIGTSPYGRILLAIRADDLVSETLGVNPNRYRLSIFVFGCAIMGLAGGLWATFNGGINPNMFEMNVLLLFWIGMLLGGNRTILGLFVGTLFIFSLRSVTLFLSLPGVTEFQLANARFIVIGVLIMLVILYRPQGLFGEKNEVL